MRAPPGIDAIRVAVQPLEISVMAAFASSLDRHSWPKWLTFG
jgi:hypothetical protein